jgi:hypothetical protein
MKNAGCGSGQAGAAAETAFFITNLTGTSRLSRGLPQEEKSFEVLFQLRCAMKNAFVPAPSFG